MTIFRGNWRLIDRMVKFVEELGAAAIHFIFVVKEGRAKEADGLELKPFEFEKALLELYHLTKDGLPIMVKPRCAPQYWRVAFQRNEDASFLQQVSKGIVTRGCSAGTGVANINPDGTVTPCAFWHMSVGNIRESKFSEVWYKSPVFLQLRNIEFLKGKCGLCEYKEVCGGCRERAYTNSGDFLAEDPSCVYRPKLCRDWNRS
jgi:radical SAM protein with 4Fe4S-binding SPASM domain